jgi:hypothetical protein
MKITGGIWDKIKALLDKTDIWSIHRRGLAAERWLQDPVLDAALAKMRLATFERWARATSVDEREACWHEWQRINAFVKALESFMADAKMIERQLAETKQ